MRYEEAERLYFRVLNVCEKIFGEEHPWVSSAQSDLAGFLKEQVRVDWNIYFLIHLKFLLVKRQLIRQPKNT